MPSRRSASRASGAQSSAWSSEATGARSSKVEPQDDDGEEMPDGEYEIEAILSHDVGKMIPGQMSYLVSWVGYSENENSWITEEDAANAGEMLSQYWKSRGSRPDIKGKKGKSVAGGSAYGRTGRRAALSTAANAAAAERSAASRKRNRANTTADALDDSLDARAERKRAREAASANFNRDAAEDPSDLEQDSDAEADLALNAKYRPEEIAKRKNLRQVKKYEAMADWENIVKVVENVELMPDSNKIVAFLLFENGSRQCYAIEVANHRCPQKLLAFYQSRIRFKPTPSDAKAAGHAGGVAGTSGVAPAQDEDEEMSS